MSETSKSQFGESIQSASDTPKMNPLLLHLIKVGKGNIFENSVEIDTAGGEIEIGNYNIFEAHVRIVNASKTQKMIIGSHNIFEMKTIVNTSLIGHFNILKTYSTINDCTLKGNNVITQNGILPPGTHR